jgi:hypothetical protein
MNNHDEMVFKNDSLHGLKDPKDKTKTQENTGNQGGYQGPNRKERDQAHHVLETRQPTDIDTNNDRNWKVAGRKSSTPLRKAATRGGYGGQSKTNSLYQPWTRGGDGGRKDGHDKAAGTVRDKGQDKAAGTVRDKGQDKAAGTVRDKGQDKAAGTVRDNKNKINRSADGDAPGGAANNTYTLRNAGGGTIEVRFMIDVNRRRDFNLCMRLREFIVAARVMDPTFSILPLGGNGGEMITKPEEWPNTKEGIDKYYSHWSRQNNVAGKIKIGTALSIMQLKNQSGTFLTYLKRKGVHINNAQLGMVETVTL